MRKYALATLALFAFGALASANAVNCPVIGNDGPTDFATCPDPVDGTDGTNGVDGAPGLDGAPGADGAAGAQGPAGPAGRDFEFDKALALSTAASTPIWLQQNQNFAVSGGLGFNENEVAFGGNAVARIPGTPLSAFGGGAVSSDGKSWVVRSGFHAGW
jgi:hypothetical protein